MAAYLIDTDVLWRVIRDPHGEIAARLLALDEANVATSVIVACELRYGAEKKRNASLSERVEALLGSLPVLALEPAVDRVYGGLRRQLESTGTLVGAHHLLIAAHAVTTGRTLITRNGHELSRVPTVALETWRGTSARESN